VSSEAAGPGPRLVYDAASDPSRSVTTEQRRSWLALVLLAVALVLALVQWQRADRLAIRVGELEGALARSQAEVAARRAQLDAIRSSVADVRERVEGLAALAGREPNVPAPPASNDAAH